jgi:ABC-type glycerol-3-phosphate transport system substrate-binding protein
MIERKIDRRMLLKAFAATSLAAPAIGLSSRTVNAANPIQLIGYRYPASEYYADKLKAGAAGHDVNVQLMPSDKVMELVNINLASNSSNLDIFMATDGLIANYAQNKWMLPLNDLWAKYKEEYDLDDIDPKIVEGLSVEGSVYVVPVEFNSLIQYYRKDLFEEKGLKPATTLDQYKANAAALQTDRQAGVIMLGRVGDPLMTETHYYLNNLADGWFDADWQPTFNSEKGVAAVAFMKEMSAFAQRGFATSGSDEAALALQQGFAAMGNHYLTRASSMDDPKKSRFVGKIGTEVAAAGNQRISLTGYAISAFSKQDPDVMFRAIMEAAKKDSMRGNVKNNVPTRLSLLADEALVKEFPYLVAAAGAAKVGKLLPHMPYFFSVGDIVSRRVSQVLQGESEPKAAMDAAAKDVRDLLTSNGFYKS